jgi:hypothetical protein
MSCQIRGNKYFTPQGQPSELYNNLKETVGEQAAEDLFVLHYTPTFQENEISPIVSNHRASVLKQIPATIQDKNWKVVKKNGFTTIQLLDENKKQLGYIRLKDFNGNFAVEAVNLNAGVEKGKGLGTALYKRAIQYSFVNNKSFYSDANMTQEARGVWNKLPAKEEQGRLKVSAFPNMFYSNGEMVAEEVIKRSQEKTSAKLTNTEIEDVKNLLMEFPNINSSVELYEKLRNAFYVNELFNPSFSSLKASGLYADGEIRMLLSNVSMLASVKDSIEKLNNTEEIFNEYPAEQIKAKLSEYNAFGKLKNTNPYTIIEYPLEIPVIDKNGEQTQENLNYPNAVKVIEDTSYFTRRIDALKRATNPYSEEALRVVEQIYKQLRKFGIRLEGVQDYMAKLTRLETFLEEQTSENLEAIEQGAPRTKTVNIKDNTDRDYVYFENIENTSEQELFDNLSIIKTDVPNVYHRVEKVEGENNYQLYKDYFGYKNKGEKQFEKPAIEIENEEYLKDEFAADFNMTNKHEDIFKIDENGIYLSSNDPITIAKAKAIIKDNNLKQLGEYSALSKRMPTLIEAETSVRLQAVNNIDTLPKPAEVEIVNNNIILTNTEDKFIQQNGQVYEMQQKINGQSVYGRLDMGQRTEGFMVGKVMPARIIEVKEIGQLIQNNKAKNKMSKTKEVESYFEC